MRGVCAFLLCLPLLAGCGCGSHPAGPPYTRTVGGITAVITPDPDPPHVGNDTGFTVRLTQGGQPLTDVGVQLSLYCVSFQRDGPSEHCTPGTEPGTYTVPQMTTGMNGRWKATATISRAGVPDVSISVPFQVEK